MSFRGSVIVEPAVLSIRASRLTGRHGCGVDGYREGRFVLLVLRAADSDPSHRGTIARQGTLVPAPLAPCLDVLQRPPITKSSGRSEFSTVVPGLAPEEAAGTRGAIDLVWNNRKSSSSPGA